MDLNALLV